MEGSEASAQLLKNKYDLHKTPEVAAAAKRTKKRTGEAVSQRPLDQIQNYLDRFKLTERGSSDKREHSTEGIKRLLHSRFVIKPDEIPESYFELQRRIAREQGHGDVEITSDEKQQLTDIVIADQKSSLDTWVDYLSSPDAPYSDALKYWSIRGITGMGEYDKTKHEFKQRSSSTTKPFPDLNREALGYVMDAVDKKYNGQELHLDAFQPEERAKFEKLLQGENFPKLYAWAVEKVTPASQDQLLDTRGEWRKYDKDSDPMPLVKSLEGHGTGWCTAAESTAKKQLENGDFYVYYSLDADGNPTIPRTAIRMEGNSIQEVRGIAPDQNLDPYINGVVEKKLEEFPDGEKYQKKAADMKHLTAIEYKSTAGQELSASDLTFLYELDSQIEGFGYRRDPRIDEIKFKRDINEDMTVIFDCEPSQIAHMADQIGPDTKAYVGPLTPGIFTLLKGHNLEHVYTSFPKEKISFDTVNIGGKTVQQLEHELANSNNQVTEWAKSMMHHPDFTTVPTSEDLEIVRLHVRDLGLKNEYPTASNIFKRAEVLGLELCPPEVGPQYRLQYTDQPMYGESFIAMKPIAGSYNHPHVFRLEHNDNGSRLSDYPAQSNDEWSPSREFVFSFRKSSPAES